MRHVTHQLLAYAYDVNLLGDNIETTKKNIETLTDASTEVGLEINLEKTKHMLLDHHQDVWQNHDIIQQTDRLKIWRSSNVWE
jgi:hypothetical protein